MMLEFLVKGAGNPFCRVDYCINSACKRRNDFQKADRQGKNPFATPGDAGFPLDPLSENS